MFRSVRVLFSFFFSLACAAGIYAQQPQPVLMASLKPDLQLRWQRTSPPQQHTDGPVLYQLVFSPGTPGAIAKFDTNARHLVSSDITENGGIVSIGSSGFTVNVNTGMVNFVNSQTFANVVSSVASGPGLSGGPITSSGTLNLDTTFTNNLYSQLAAANTFTTGTQLVQTVAAGTVGLAVQGASTQTANLEEWRNSAATALASVTASGKFNGDGSGLTNLSGSQLTDGGIDRQQVALLKWYVPNQAASFAVGTAPTALAFDGASIWVTIFSGNTVSKLRAADGTVLGTFAVGAGPVAVAFDGASIWVASQNTNTVSKLRASDGTVLGTFAVGTDPVSVAFDGASIWVANHGSNTVTKLRASDGACVGTCTFAVGTAPSGVAFDGTDIWVANQISNTVSKLRASDGTVLGTFAVGSFPGAVAFDGANIWVANVAGNSVSELRASDGTMLGTFAVGTNPSGVVFDGASIWVANQNSNTVSKLRASDGTVLGTFAVGTNPSGVAFDGANVWVTDLGSNIVNKL